MSPDVLRQLQSATDRSAVEALAPRLRMVVAAANDLLEADGVGVLLLDDDNHIRTVATTDSATEALERVQEHLSIGPGIDALKARRTVVVTDLALHDEYRPIWQRLASDGVRAVLSAPIWASGDVVGNLNAVRSVPHTWTDAQVSGSEVFARVIGGLLELSAATARHLPGGAHGRTHDPFPIPGTGRRGEE